MVTVNIQTFAGRGLTLINLISHQNKKREEKMDRILMNLENDKNAEYACICPPFKTLSP